MNVLTTEAGFVSLNKHGEQLCGDKVEIIENDDSLTVVLADGLGSGVKANILATLTSKIIATMISNGMPIDECVKTIACTLPVCSQRQVAYSTFSIIQITDSKHAKIIQFDNPDVILLRDGKNYEYPRLEQVIENKKIYISNITLKENDIFVAMSDGAIYAGVGQNLNYGWQRENIVNFLEAHGDDIVSAKMAATIVAEECNDLYAQMPGDDTTIAAVKVRKRQLVNLMIGPPADPADVPKVMQLFFSKGGEKIVCGGTTSNLTAQYLKTDVTTELDYSDPQIPPIGHISGVDLVTEGVITISKVMEYANEYLENSSLAAEWANKKDGASLISQKLFETATDINFFVGKAINPAHQNPNLPINFSIKIQIIEKLIETLKKMGKKVKVSYF